VDSRPWKLHRFAWQPPAGHWSHLDCSVGVSPNDGLTRLPQRARRPNRASSKVAPAAEWDSELPRRVCRPHRVRETIFVARVGLQDRGKKRQFPKCGRWHRPPALSCTVAPGQDTLSSSGAESASFQQDHRAACFGTYATLYGGTWPSQARSFVDAPAKMYGNIGLATVIHRHRCLGQLAGRL
jgi:hypothetical protein